VDYNSFTIFANEQYFIIPPGYARRSSRFQNVISLNGADFRADPSLNVRIEAFISEKDFSYTVGNGTEGFLTQLGVGSYKRHMLMLAGKWLFIYDDLRLNETGRKNRIFNHIGWTVHSDPKTHQFHINGNSVDFVSLNGKDPLHMYMMNPQNYGWERVIFQSKKGKPMIESLILSKPEFYENRQNILSAWTWEEHAAEPEYIENREVIIILADKFKAIGFAKKYGIPDIPSDRKLVGRELLIFGSDEKDPGNIVRAKDGQIQLINR